MDAKISNKFFENLKRWHTHTNGQLKGKPIVKISWKGIHSEGQRMLSFWEL